MGKLYIEVITNSLSYNVGPAVDALAAYIRAHTPYIPSFTYANVNLRLSFKDFQVRLPNGDSGWGLDGIKGQLRALAPIPEAANHIVIFLYEYPRDLAHSLGAWTYPNDLRGAAFTETPCTHEWVANGNLYRILTHEIEHCFHRLCWWNGVATNDTMDLYDREYEIEAPNGNRARNLLELSPHWDAIINYQNKLALNFIERILVAISNTFTPMVTSKLQAMSDAIKKREGWSAPGEDPRYPNGTRSWRNKNPGNLKFTHYTQQYLGAVGEDRSGITDPTKPGFAIFATEEKGDAALIQFIRDAATRQLRPYHKFDPNIPYHKVLLPNGQKGDELPDLTLIDFFNIFAPSNDNNEPNGYALFVANWMKVPPQTLIKTLVRWLTGGRATDKTLDNP